MAKALREKELLMSAQVTQVTYSEIEELLNWKSLAEYQDCLYRIMCKNYVADAFLRPIVESLGYTPVGKVNGEWQKIKADDE